MSFNFSYIIFNIEGIQRNLPQREKGNANIGLIQVALTSANPLDIEVTLIDDNYSFFAITVKVDK